MVSLKLHPIVSGLKNIKPGFLSIKSANRVYNCGAKKPVNDLVLNTNNIAQIAPLKQIEGSNYGARLNTFLGESYEIPYLMDHGYPRTYDYIVNRVSEAAEKGFSVIF